MANKFWLAMAGNQAIVSEFRWNTIGVRGVFAFWHGIESPSVWLSERVFGGVGDLVSRDFGEGVARGFVRRGEKRFRSGHPLELAVIWWGWLDRSSCLLVSLVGTMLASLLGISIQFSPFIWFQAMESCVGVVIFDLGFLLICG
ncbi:hypothetical protein Dimus_019039 [Dionaea muscipula]